MSEEPPQEPVALLLWHVEQVCGPISTETCEVSGDDDRSVLAHNFTCVLATLRSKGDAMAEALEGVREALDDSDECEARAIIKYALAAWRGEASAHERKE